MVNDDGSVDIRIELPLPIDITGTLINIIGLTWPDAVIKDDGNDKKWRSENRLVLSIPEKNRHKSAKKAAKYAEVKAHLNAESDALINELDPNAIAMGLPEWLANQYIAMARLWMDRYPEATNYLESTLRDRERNQDWVFTVAKGTQRTPHALRQQAEDKLEKIRALCQLRQDEGHLDVTGEVLALIGESA